MKTIKNKIVYEKNINEIPAKALAIVFPENPQEIKNLIRLGKEDIVPRGNGTSFTGGCIPKNSVIVDFSKMNKILEISPEKKIAIVEPGVLLHELNDELRPYNLEFPIEPLFGGIETIGGMIAKNSCGNREIKYGRMISWIEYLEVINGKGEQLKISRSDLSDFVGMEGTTGLIIKAALRLTNLKKRSMLILKVSTLQDVFIANRKLRLKQDIASIDLINPDISFILGLEKKYHVFVELENLEGTFKDEEYQKFIKLKNKAYRRTAQEGFYYMTNIKFLIDSLQDFLIYLEEKKVPYFAHLASGVVYPLFRQEDLLKLEEVTKFAKKLRGRIAYNFGVGMTKHDSLELGEIELARRVKNRQDPSGRLNKDKLLDSKIFEKMQKQEQIQEAAKEELIKEEKKAAKKQEALNKQEIKKETSAKQLLEQNPNLTIKREERELSNEEKEKIKKIASGFFGGSTKNDNPAK
jgi:FAD/FMN-containing dehydrogenase